MRSVMWEKALSHLCVEILTSLFWQYDDHGENREGTLKFPSPVRLFIWTSGKTRFDPHGTAQQQGRTMKVCSNLICKYVPAQAESRCQWDRQCGNTIGSYTAARSPSTCGPCIPRRALSVMEDTGIQFYKSWKIRVGLFWTSAGYVEYKFCKCGFPEPLMPSPRNLSMEICSRHLGYRGETGNPWMCGVDKRCGLRDLDMPRDLEAWRGDWTLPLPYGRTSTQYGMSTWVLENMLYVEVGL